MFGALRQGSQRSWGGEFEGRCPSWEGASVTRPASIRCDASLSVRALPGVPLVAPGDDLATLVIEALARAGTTLESSDVLVVASKVVSRSEGRLFDLAKVAP